MQTENKVVYNFKNAYYATFTDEKTATYDAPKRMAGAVQLVMKAKSELDEVWADGIAYYSTYSDSGYEGDLEMVNLSEEFVTDIFGDIKDEKGVILEKVGNKKKPFALLFEFDGDQQAQRHVFYKCSASRPDIEGETDKDGKHSYKNAKMSMKAVPLEDGSVHAKTGSTTDPTTYSNWYKNVYRTAAAAPASEMNVKK